MANKMAFKLLHLAGCNLHFIMSLVVVVPTPFMVLPTLDSSAFLAKDGKQRLLNVPENWKNHGPRA
jgi:hypothetical protein